MMQLYDIPFLPSPSYFLKTSVVSLISAKYNLKGIVSYQEKADKINSSIAEKSFFQQKEKKRYMFSVPTGIARSVR